MRFTRVFLLLLFLLSTALNTRSQDQGKLFVLESVKLDPVLAEISGITFSNGRIYCINDSGNTNDVFVLEPGSFRVISSERIRGARNTDWEEISSYNNFLYIGDFGNNFGGRDDLVVYRLCIDSLGKDKAGLEKISFEYSRQNTFSISSYKKHSWDCEAMIVDGPGIWLFSKDWLDRTCRLYRLDKQKTLDKQAIIPVDSLDLGYLVTGAFFDKDSRRQYLCGYRGKKTYITIFTDTDSPTLSGNYISYSVADLEHAQVESLFVKDNLMYLASERAGKKQSVYIIPVPEIIR